MQAPSPTSLHIPAVTYPSFPHVTAKPPDRCGNSLRFCKREWRTRLGALDERTIIRNLGMLRVEQGKGKVYAALKAWWWAPVDCKGKRIQHAHLHLPFHNLRPSSRPPTRSGLALLTFLHLSNFRLSSPRVTQPQHHHNKRPPKSPTLPASAQRSSARAHHVSTSHCISWSISRLDYPGCGVVAHRARGPICGVGYQGASVLLCGKAGARVGLGKCDGVACGNGKVSR